MARPTANLRLFVAAYPPPNVARDLLARLRSFVLPDRARPVPAEQVHLTLQFIGDTPSGEMDSTRESVERAAAGLPAFTLRLQQLIALPERGPRRLIAVETDSPPALIELHNRLALRFARKTRGRPSDRFRPHLTLCRFASPVGAFVIDEPALSGGFVVERIALMRSTLGHQGAAHHEVATVTLRCT